jgi:membrane protease YdiL (CAAX protease family)
MKKAISYTLIFIGIQIIGGAVITNLWSLITGNSDKTAAMLITTTGVIGLLTIVIFLWTRYAEVSPTWLRTRPWTVLSWSVIAALGALIPSAWIQEQMPELPNFAEQEFGTIMGTPWGYLVIGLLAPLSEEIVLRGAILKELLKSEKLSTWTAIAISALFFALVHMNPAQMPHAFIIGLLLGWMYYRTGSILPGVAYHWANNSVAYVMYALYPDPDMKLIDIFKGSEQHVYMALGFSLLILLPALYQLHLWMRRAE